MFEPNIYFGISVQATMWVCKTATVPTSPVQKQTTKHVLFKKFSFIFYSDSVIMKRAIDFLIEKKYFTSVEGAKEKLRELWFQPYDRDGTSNLVLGSR